MGRRIAGSRLEIPASEWNQIQEDSSRLGRNESRRPIEPNYIFAIGRNSSGATITAGSPVYYTTFNLDGTVSSYTPKPQGYYDIEHCFWPQNTTDRAAFAAGGLSYSRVGVALEDIKNTEPGRFAIGGVVGVKCTTPSGVKRYARPTVKPNSYESQLTADVWGFKILCVYSSWALINLDELYRGILEGVTQGSGLVADVEGMVTVNGADFPAITKESNIPSGKTVWLFPTDTQWLASKVC